LTSQKGQRPAVEGDDVQLSPASPVVAFDDPKAPPRQVLGRQLLTHGAEAMSNVVAHCR